MPKSESPFHSFHPLYVNLDANRNAPLSVIVHANLDANLDLLLCIDMNPLKHPFCTRSASHQL